MKINKIEHVSINAVDIQQTFHFYGQVLGFEQQQTVDRGEFNITYFSLPGGTRLEIFDYHGRNPQGSRSESEAGLRHLAFQVDDVATQEQLLRTAGVEITLPTCDLPDLGVRVCLFRDPNGVTLEFCENL